MRITKQQAEENRTRVIETAARLFRERGFDGVGVADLMHEAGLTHGGFYNHFQSKDDLGAAACAHALSRAATRIESVADAQCGDTATALHDYRRHYLSRETRDSDAVRCPMVAFGADVSRQGRPLREVYAAGLKRYLDAFVRAFAAEQSGELADANLRSQAIANFATMVGAVSLARSVGEADPVLSDEILDTVLATLEAPKHAPVKRTRASRAKASAQDSAIAATSRP